MRPITPVLTTSYLRAIDHSDADLTALPMPVPVSQLRLDPENPRLPPDVSGAPQETLFAFLYENGVLEELVSSMLDNGFFSSEPLVVLPESPDHTRIVVEGNRRLAALMLIHGMDPINGFETFGEPTPEQKEALAQVPVIEVPDRESVKQYLGYRHISGLKPWPAEAKARFVTREVDLAVQRGQRDPFAFVGKEVGSNALGVRNWYLAFASLRFAEQQCSAPTHHVLNRRFGVWLRCLNSPEIREYIGLGEPRTFAEVEEALQRLSCEGLTEVVADLVPVDGRRPVIADSRQITEYGQVLANPSAHAVLRRTANLDLAAESIREENLAVRLNNLEELISSVKSEIERVGQPPAPEVLAAISRLDRSVRLLAASAQALQG